MKTKKQLATEKMMATTKENQKKIIEIGGYEIWSDPLQYITIKNGKNLYFSTFKNALIDIHNEVLRSKLHNVSDLAHAINLINDIDKSFPEALSPRLAGLQGTNIQ